jgi:hypothetical protein
LVKSWLIRSIKHLTKAPFPPFRYLNNEALQAEQKISTVFVGPFLLGLAISPPLIHNTGLFEVGKFRVNNYQLKLK